MPYVILGVAVLIGLVLLARAFVNAEPKSLVRTLKWSGAILGGLFVVYLVATRQLEWLISLAAVSMPFLLRWRRVTAMGRGGSSALTRDEAYKVLGLQPGATPEAIKEAHRRLMRQFHPDVGGSDYLAARINEAKDLLLGD